MRRIWELLVDQETAGGRAVTSVVVVVLALLLAGVVGRVVAGRLEDRYARYYARKLVRYAFNYSAIFEFIWEELSVPVAHDEDWRAARDFLAEEARRASSTVGAEEAINEMARRYPIARADVEPRVHTRATDNWVELSARFVVPVRSARRAKDEMTERVLARLQEAQIPIASTTAEVTLHD
ncbi:MAG: hypothetical protein R2755_00250 [Acidimicrobiales bacterium]